MTPASIPAVDCHIIRHLSSSHTGTPALQAMPFLATVTITLVVCTIANMLSTVQGHIARMLRLDAKMVILISCAGGIVSSAATFVFTRLFYRKMEVALQMDSQPDSLKALGKVRQLCRGLGEGCHLQAAWQANNLLHANLQHEMVLSLCHCLFACSRLACTSPWGIAPAALALRLVHPLSILVT